MSARHSGNHSNAEGRPSSQVGVAFQVAGAGLILIAAFVPWVRSHALFLAIPVSGIKTDYGRIFPFLALAAFGLLAYQWSFGWRKWAPGIVFLLAIVALVVAILYGVQVKERVGRINQSSENKSAGPFVLPGGSLFNVDLDVGYYLTLLGAGCLGAGAVEDLRAGWRRVSRGKESGRTA